MAALFPVPRDSSTVEYVGSPTIILIQEAEEE